MPIYDYHCSSCDMLYEIFESMTAYHSNPTPHCPKCDPKGKKPTTMYRYLGASKHSFKITGEGVYKPGWH
jgi:putative FmdB family regulatory protein